jgi:hypothetical protein
LAQQLLCLQEVINHWSQDYASISLIGAFKMRIGPAILFIVHQRVADFFYQCTNKAQVQAFDFPTVDFSLLINKIMMGEAINLDIEIPSNFFSAEALILLRRDGMPQHPVSALPSEPPPDLGTSGSGKGQHSSNRATHTNPNMDGELSQAIASYVTNYPGCHVTVSMISQAADMTRSTLVDQCNLHEVTDCFNYAILGLCRRRGCSRSHAQTAQWPHSVKQMIIEQLPSIRPQKRGFLSPSPSHII